MFLINHKPYVYLGTGISIFSSWESGFRLILFFRLNLNYRCLFLSQDWARALFHFPGYPSNRVGTWALALEPNQNAAHNRILPFSSSFPILSVWRIEIANEHWEPHELLPFCL
jgi:hypothetical protein